MRYLIVTLLFLFSSIANAAETGPCPPGATVEEQLQKMRDKFDLISEQHKKAYLFKPTVTEQNVLVSVLYYAEPIGILFNWSRIGTCELHYKYAPAPKMLITFSAEEIKQWKARQTAIRGVKS
jgi:hypothetical protein